MKKQILLSLFIIGFTSMSYSQTGLSCIQAIAATVGENSAPSAPYWFTYTSTEVTDKVITISSLGKTVTDTYVAVYDNCGLNMINSDDNSNGSLQSWVSFIIHPGQTIVIEWADYGSSSSFVWDLTLSEVITGDVCEAPFTATIGDNVHPNNKSVYWYNFTSPTDRYFEVGVMGVGISADVRIYSNCSDYKGDAIANDRPYISPNETVSIRVENNDVANNTSFVWPLAEYFPIPGEICESPLTASIGSNSDVNDRESYWYSFIAPSEGYYKISTLNANAEFRFYNGCNNQKEIASDIAVISDIFYAIADENVDIEVFNPSWNSSSFTWDIDTYTTVEGEFCTNAANAITGINTLPATANDSYWYTYTMTSDGKLQITSTSGKNVVVNSNTCASLIREGWGLENVTITTLSSGDVIFIEWEATGGGNFDWDLSIVPLVVGDNCTLAVAANEGLNVAPRAKHWYTYTATSDGDVTISSIGTATNDTYLKVYSDCNGALIGENDDASGLQSELTLPLTSNQTIYILWDDTYSSEGFEWNLTLTQLGVDCTSPAQAIVGTNTTPQAPYWYEYTPDSYGKITISSVGLTTENTDLVVFSDCAGSAVVTNDDFEGTLNYSFRGVKYPQAIQSVEQSQVEIDAVPGQPIYIQWKDTHSSNGFNWDITLSPYISGVLEADSLILVELYNTTDGTNWTKNANWLTGPVDSWYGVQVTNGRVTILNLQGNNLTNQIPASLGSLTNLVILDLRGNPLSGQIPLELTNLSNLEIFVLTGVKLNGSIHPEIGSMINLKMLDLEWMQLNSPIPPELGNLINLTHLYLGGATNQLSGTIPAELGNMTNLTHLFLNNQSQLSGSIPSSLGNLSNLKVMYFDDMPQITGTLPASFNNLSNIEWIWIRGTQISGILPPEWGNWSNEKMWLFGLENNQLSGSIPAEWSNIKVFPNLSNNQLSGTIPIELGNATFTSLYLANNQITGHIPPELGNNTNLTGLNLSNNQISGSIPAEMGNLTNLKNLSLSNNQLSGEIPTELGNLTNLSIDGWGGLFLNGNQLTGTVPSELGNLTNLTNLRLDYNQLTGPIPAELGNLTKLYKLDLSNNQLTGTIPAELGNLDIKNSWGGLYLQSNQLTGDVPVELVGLTEMVNFNISYNQLNGLPDLSGLSALTSFVANSNMFTFGDLEPNANIAGAVYHPQQRFGNFQEALLTTGDSYTMEFTVDGTANLYQWYKDGVAISGANGTSYTINSYTATDDGLYTLKVTNTLVPGVTLESKEVSIGNNEGVVCSTAKTALNGTNNTLSAPYWFTYTPTEDEIVTVSSIGTTTEDTFLKIYRNCEGQMIDQADNTGSNQSELVLRLNTS